MTEALPEPTPHAPSAIPGSGPGSVRSRALLICLGLAALTLATYWRIWQADFTNYDDPNYVTENPHVSTGLSFQNLVWALTTGHAANWHPLTWLSHMVDVQLFGLRPAGHHFTSLLLHLANTLLVFLLLGRLTGALWRSALVATLFALHPLHVESVAWIAERKDVLSAFFFLLTVGAYGGYVRKSTVHSPKPKAQNDQSTVQPEQSTPESLRGPVHGPPPKAFGVQPTVHPRKPSGSSPQSKTTHLETGRGLQGLRPAPFTSRRWSCSPWD